MNLNEFLSLKNYEKYIFIEYLTYNNLYGYSLNIAMNTQPKIDINDIKNEISYCLDQAIDREIQLFEVQSVFRKALNGMSGRSFDDLKLRTLNENDEQKLLNLSTGLSTLINSHISYDDKFISLFKDSKFLVQINDTFQKYFSDPKNYANNINDKYQPFKNLELEEGVFFYQFSIVRQINIRQEISISNLKASAATQFHNVYGVKRIPLNCFDFIILDLNKNLVVTGIDLARVLGKNELNVALNSFYINLRNIINDKSLSSFLDKPHDLFSKIQIFYDEVKNATNGVTEINFITPAGTAHYEKLRGKSKDLRIAPYHEKGVEGVKNEEENGVLLNNDITPYKIGKKYYRDSGDIEIHLKSSYLALHSVNGSHLYHAYIYATRNYTDLSFALQKLVS